MLNQVVIVGRLCRDIQVNDSEKGKKVATCSLAVPRSFKNHEGIYETDFIDCILWDAIASNTSSYCKKGDIVGIKGRIQSRKEEETSKTILEVVAEKVTFLSSKKNNEEEDD